ncbi:hypothetical protein Javan407_0015 [Streptococcus phage Javan407]|nr:hypothetical protein Javan407_0015 [Streptococcus phage Javan407]
MIDKERIDNIRKRANEEIFVLSVFLDEAVIQLGDTLGPDEILKVACTAYISAGLSDIDGSVEGLYEHIGQL